MDGLRPQPRPLAVHTLGRDRALYSRNNADLFRSLMHIDWYARSKTEKQCKQRTAASGALLLLFPEVVTEFLPDLLEVVCGKENGQVRGSFRYSDICEYTVQQKRLTMGELKDIFLDIGLEKEFGRSIGLDV
jgi:hypothetical protein